MNPKRQILRMRGVLRHAAAWLCLASGMPLRTASSVQPQEVEAAFLLNFTKFIEWPTSAFEDASSPLTICLYGDDPFGSKLDQLVEGETVNGRKLTVQRIRRVPPPKSCQVVYIGGAEKNAASLVSELGTGVLTVSDRDVFLREGGIIAFVVQGGHVRFDVNQRAASKASLSISARLLGVARSVQK